MSSPDIRDIALIVPLKETAIVIGVETWASESVVYGNVDYCVLGPEPRWEDAFRSSGTVARF